MDPLRVAISDTLPRSSGSRLQVAGRYVSCWSPRRACTPTAFPLHFSWSRTAGTRWGPRHVVTARWTVIVNRL